MIVMGLMLGFAFVVVLLGGNNADVSQLYYDADFTELYDVKDEESSERKYKGGKPVDSGEAETEAVSAEVVSGPPSLGEIVGAAGVAPPPPANLDTDDALLAEDIYAGIDL